MNIKQIIKNPVVTHLSAVLLGYIFAIMVINLHSSKKFTKRQNAAVYTTEERGKKAQLNREIFDTDNFESVEWRYYTNQRVGEVLGKTAAKEFVVDIDGVKSGVATSEEVYGDVRDCCAEAVVKAYNDASSRLGLSSRYSSVVPFPAAHCDTTKSFHKAMRNAKHMVNYFAADSVPNSIIKNPIEKDFKSISAGSIIRKGRHAYIYMGIGYTDKDGRTFVADTRGKPVVASIEDKKMFKYFDWSKCTVIDVALIVQHKLQNDIQRHVR